MPPPDNIPTQNIDLSMIYRNMIDITMDRGMGMMEMNRASELLGHMANQILDELVSETVETERQT